MRHNLELREKWKITKNANFRVNIVLWKKFLWCCRFSDGHKLQGYADPDPTSFWYYFENLVPLCNLKYSKFLSKFLSCCRNPYLNPRTFRFISPGDSVIISRGDKIEMWLHFWRVFFTFWFVFCSDIWCIKKPKLIVNFETPILSVGDKALDKTHLKKWCFWETVRDFENGYSTKWVFFHEICNSNSSLWNLESQKPVLTP